MRSSDPISRRTSAVSQHLCLLLIAVVGLLLRVYRLDVISFRYDTAETLFRAGDILRGHWPFLGIVNSLGFHNPPGLPWSILPPLLFTPSPAVAAGWFALLCLTGIWPLYQVCRTQFGRWSFVLPCVACALMPNQVFDARTIWAQWLMVPLYSWILWLLMLMLSKPANRRHNALSTAAVALGWCGIAIHLAGLVYLVLIVFAVLLAIRIQDRSLKNAIRPILIGSLPALLLLASAYDWLSTRNQPPAEKPAHIAKFESLMPPPLPLVQRVKEGVADQFNVFSNAGVADELPLEKSTAVIRHAVQIADGLFLVLTLMGAGICAYSAIRRQNGVSTPRIIPMGLLAWIFLPAIIGSAVLPRSNATYFAPGIPALLLLLGLVMQLVQQRLQLAGTAVLAIFAVISAGAYCLLTVRTIDMIGQSGFVNNQYYIPLRDQLTFARELSSNQVSVHRFSHLSGEWFQRPYDYLVGVVCGAKELTTDPRWAVVEDANLRPTQQQRVHFFAAKATLRHGSVGAALFDDPIEAARFIRDYYSIPVDSTGTVKP